MFKASRFDAHCHLFNLFYALKEISNIGWDILRKEYELNPAVINWGNNIEKDDESESWGDLKFLPKLIDWIIDLYWGCFGSETKHYQLLIKAARSSKGWKYKTNRVIPLMMDIFYILAPPRDSSGKKAQSLKLSVEDSRYTDLTEKISARIQKKISNLSVSAECRIAGLYKQIKKKKKKHIKSRKSKDSASFYETWGFKDHMQALKWLQFWNKKKVFPFFAVDPRRPGVIDKARSCVSDKGPFYGIKLYTYLGYKPDCPTLMPLYDFCIKYDIPITVHCNKNGFPVMTDWPYIDYADPRHWTAILKQEKYAALRINFAHLGMDFQEGQTDWTRTVLEFINTYKNVYADVACFVDPGMLDIINHLWGEHVKLRERLMFGTDYVIMLLAKCIPDYQEPLPERIVIPEEYFRNFREKLAESILHNLTIENPKRFLKLG